MHALKISPSSVDDGGVDSEDARHEVPAAPRRPSRSPETRRQRGSRGDEAAADPDLSRCGSCGSVLVQPVDWALVGRCHWRVTLRCPNCEWSGTGVFDQTAIDRYDRDLDRGTRKLTSTLNRVSKACMEAEIERFVQALETDLIVPFDF